ncbi:hypothetical protein [Emticicia fontis]
MSVTLPAIALLDLNNNSAITMAFQSPTEAGSPITAPASNSTKWINLTSAVASGATRRITAQVVSGSVPNGVRLKLETGVASGIGSGTFGSVTSPVYLTTSATTIINGIGGAFTGNDNNGYNLTYTLEIQNYSQLLKASASFSVIYTLIDN